MTLETESSFLWTNATLLEVEVQVAREVARALLPAALQVPDPATATLFVADYPATQFGSVYREAAVFLHATDDQGPLLHCAWMVVDDDVALIIGRDLLGCPKKMAQIELDAHDAVAVGTVRRQGVEVMRLEAAVHEPESEPAPMLGRRMVNVIGTPPTGFKLLELPPTPEAIHASRRATVRVTLGSNGRDQLDLLQAVPTGRARLVHFDFGTPGAQFGRLVGDVDADWSARNFYARVL